MSAVHKILHIDDNRKIATDGIKIPGYIDLWKLLVIESMVRQAI